MRLYLVQHGEAVEKDVDPDRPLSDQGREDIVRLARWLSDRGIEVALVLHSGKTRARQTAELLGGLLKDNGEIRQQDGLAPNDSPETFLDAMRKCDDDVLVASHLPFVGRVLALAICGDSEHSVAEYQPGTVACIEHDSKGNWSICLFMRPRIF